MGDKIFRVGLIVDTEYVSKYVDDLVKWAEGNPNVEISVAVMLGEQNIGIHAPILSRILRHLAERGLRSLLRSAGWTLLVHLEKLKLKSIGDHSDHLDSKVISHTVRRLHVRPVRSRSGLVYRFTDEDLASIKDFKLDLLIRCGSGILRGAILEATRLGILSFHHGDNRSNRGGPAGFWEVFNREPETGFVIQKLTEELDGGDVIFRGSFPTQSFYLFNQANVLLRSNFYMKSLLEKVSQSSQLPKSEPKLPYSGVLLRQPGIRQQLAYMVRLLGTATLNRLKRSVFRVHYRWNVAFDFGNWRDLVMWRAQKVKNPPGRFLADPFVVANEGRNYCFVEDFNLKEGRGSISVMYLDEKGPSQPTNIIREDFHMSFPFVFEFNGRFYMIPETWQAMEIRLYECVSFPFEWKFKSVLIGNISAADSIIFQHGKLWWLLTNTNSLNQGEHSSELSIFYSDSPLSDSWSPHPLNPVILDASRARNGGHLYDGRTHYRVSQKHGFGVYGLESRIMRIDEISEVAYSETLVGQVNPKFGFAFGTHHLHSNGQLTVFDFQRNERW